jgi:hypothetical protein
MLVGTWGKSLGGDDAGSSFPLQTGQGAEKRSRTVAPRLLAPQPTPVERGKSEGLAQDGPFIFRSTE